MRARVAAKVLSMVREDSTFDSHCGAGKTDCKVPKDQGGAQQRAITFSWCAGDRTLRGKAPVNRGFVDAYRSRIGGWTLGESQKTPSRNTREQEGTPERQI